MQISYRELMTALHGMGFAALFLLAFSGAFVELYRSGTARRAATRDSSERRFLRVYFWSMVILGWAAVLSGAYIVYPWYRAHPPAGVVDLTAYPQRSLIANPATAKWHTLGMEWKEHVAWFAPIAITMVAFVFGKYGYDLSKHRAIRVSVLAFAVAAFVAAGIAGLFGAFINKRAPITGAAVVNVVSAIR